MLQYRPEWLQSPDAFPISLSMPLGDRIWTSAVVAPWLMNLLPEGDPLRAMMRALGVAREDVLGLVERIGGDLAGALSGRAAGGEQRGLPRYRNRGRPGADH